MVPKVSAASTRPAIVASCLAPFPIVRPGRPGSRSGLPARVGREHALGDAFLLLGQFRGAPDDRATQHAQDGRVEPCAASLYVINVTPIAFLFT